MRCFALIKSLIFISTLFFLHKNANAQSLVSTGDELQLNILNDEHFSGIYSVTDEGYLLIPHLSKSYVNGLNIDEILQMLKTKFVHENFFVTKNFGLSLTLKKQGSISVSVSGNVYTPGKVILVTADPKLDDLERYRKNNFNRRYLRDAIKSAGGVIPTADVSKVVLKRGNIVSLHDLTGIFSGRHTNNIELITGDEIFVPKGDSYNEDLAISSLITYDEIPVHLVTQEKQFNHRTVVYGSRISQVLSATDCLDKNLFTSGLRSAIVVRDYPVYEERKIFKLDVRKIISSPNKDFNIKLHPHDVVMCSSSPLDIAVNAAQKTTDILKTTFPFTDYFLKSTFGLPK